MFRQDLDTNKAVKGKYLVRKEREIKKCLSSSIECVNFSFFYFKWALNGLMQENLFTFAVLL